MLILLEVVSAKQTISRQHVGVWLGLPCADIDDGVLVIGQIHEQEQVALVTIAGGGVGLLETETVHVRELEGRCDI